MSPSSIEPEDEELAAWGLARIKDAANQITESIDVPTLLLMQAAFVLGLILKDSFSFDASSFLSRLLFEATSKADEKPSTLTRSTTDESPTFSPVSPAPLPLFSPIHPRSRE